MVLISLCLIVKNEELTLSGCLDSIANFLDEIVIVDTGSTDRTKEIALKYTDKVYDYVWTNDFAAARNFSLSKATNEYVLVLDSDEITESINISEIRSLIEQNPTKIGRLLRINEFTRKGIPYKFSERVNRLFSKECFQYEGIIHEQVVPVAKAYPEGETYLIPLTISHSGYEGDLSIRKNKTERNIILLKSALAQNPEDPYLLYQLGKSYYMQEDYITASDYFGQALYFDLNPGLEYVQDMVESYGYALINSEQYETALQLLGVYEEFSHSADFQFLIALIFMNNGKFPEAIEEFLKATNKSEGKMEGVNSFLAYYNIGVIYECIGNQAYAKSFYQKCGNYEPALQRLNN